jgi:predicted DNA-binding protein with PD1-like motif
MSSLQDFQKQTGLKSGSLNGLGVFNNTSLGFYKFNKDGTPGKTHSESLVEGNREVVSFHCNFTTSIFKNATTGVEATAPHCHIALAGTAEEIPEKGTGGFPVVGGHFISGKVGVVAEFVVTSFDTQVTKVPSEAFGGRVIDLGNDLEAAELKNAP